MPRPKKIPTASGIPVYCSHQKIVPIESLKPHPDNPNTHPAEQVRLLAKIIQEQGWRQCITISSRSGYIVRGHARLLAADQIGANEVPIDTQPYKSDESEWADLIADNRIAELAQMEPSLLAKALSKFNATVFDIELTGFDMKGFKELMASAFPEPKEAPDEFPEYDEDISTEYCCPKCGYEWSGKPK